MKDLPRTCTFCLKSGLYWRMHNGALRLSDPITGLAHSCRQKEQNRRGGLPAFNPPIVPPKKEEPKIEVIPVKPIPKRIWSGKHKCQDELVQDLNDKQNVLIVGPAGSGKTFSAHKAAQILSLSYYPQSVGPQTSKSDLIGYMDAHSHYVRTPLRDAYEYGGVYLLDEVDAGNAGILTILNAALSNSVCGFPDKTQGVERHENFRCIAAANTFGQGANRQYVGRQQLDAASLNRFVGIEWDYDECMEEELGKSQPDWTLYVWSLRKAADKLGIKRVFGTRQIQQGCAILNGGRSFEDAKRKTVFFGVPSDEVKKLEANL